MVSPRATQLACTQQFLSGTEPKNKRPELQQTRSAAPLSTAAWCWRGSHVPADEQAAQSSWHLPEKLEESDTVWHEEPWTPHTQWNEMCETQALRDVTVRSFQVTRSWAKSGRWLKGTACVGWWWGSCHGFTKLWQYLMPLYLTFQKQLKGLERWPRD